MSLAAHRGKGTHIDPLILVGLELVTPGFACERVHEQCGGQILEQGEGRAGHEGAGLVDLHGTLSQPGTEACVQQLCFLDKAVGSFHSDGRRGEAGHAGCGVWRVV